nr:uncharacterized protein LOC110086981 isoform X2 [Pogona vitticeps]
MIRGGGDKVHHASGPLFPSTGSRGVEEEGEGQEKAKGRQPQSPRCPMESGCPPVPSPVGSPPFKTDFEEEEEEEEEDDADLTPETLAGFTDEGGHTSTGMGGLAFGSSPVTHFRSVGAWGCSPPSSCLPPGALF